MSPRVLLQLASSYGQMKRHASARDRQSFACVSLRPSGSGDPVCPALVPGKITRGFSPVANPQALALWLPQDILRLSGRYGTARDELAAAREAYVSLKSPHKAESVECGRGALWTGEVLFDDRLYRLHPSLDRITVRPSAFTAMSRFSLS